MATLDELRLQQLLQPFENQNTGVMSTNSALPFINTGQVYQNLQNQDLINQIIQQNMQKSIGSFINVPQDYYPTNTGGITELAPLQNLGIDTSYGVANEPDVEQVEYLPGQEPSGIKKFINKVSSIPGVIGTGIGALLGRFNPISMLGSLIGGGLGSLRNLNQRIQGSTFGRSATLADYFQARRDQKAREEAAARGLAKQRSQAMQAMRSNQAYSGEGGGARPGGFGKGAGDFSASDPTATEGSF